MAYDARRHVVVRFGGEGRSGATSGDTYLWDGKAWARSAASGPPARFGASMAFDAARGVIVLYGGFATAGSATHAGAAPPPTPLGDTWTWDGRSWTQQHPVHPPPPRGESAMAFDTPRGQIVLFGGKGATTIYSATWTWNGTDWNLQHPPQDPPGRHYAQMVFDEAVQLIVLFGGSIPGVFYNDLWTWDGVQWARHPTAPSPPARVFFAMAYDGNLKSVIVLSGEGQEPAGPPYLDDMWAWDGKSWSQPVVSLSPAPRWGPTATWDAARRAIVLFGGGPENAYCGDFETWTWDGARWLQR